MLPVSVYVVGIYCSVVFVGLQEREKIQLLDSYQSMSSENDRLEVSCQQSLDEAADVHSQLVNATRVRGGIVVK